MKWVTRNYVHLDRVASAWLIRRFVDRDCDLTFVPSAEEAAKAKTAIPFAVPGAELSARDGFGSAFRKILKQYEIRDEALEMVADIVESGIAYALSDLKGDAIDGGDLKRLEGIGLSALSEGMIYLSEGDAQNIENSAQIYEALYAFCRAKCIGAGKPEILQKAFPERWEAMKAELALDEGGASGLRL